MKYKLSSLQCAGNKVVNEAKAMLDLLNENQKTSVRMEFSRANCGRANLSRQVFTLPIHAINASKPIEYTYYYVIHEFTHAAYGISGHGQNFKRHERELLALFGMTIEYARAYPKALYANGEKVYTKSKF